MSMVVHPRLAVDHVRERLLSSNEGFIFDNKYEIFVKDVRVNPTDLPISAVIRNRSIAGVPFVLIDRHSEVI